MPTPSSTGSEKCADVPSQWIGQFRPDPKSIPFLPLKMNNADLYATANGLQRRDAEDVMGEFFHLIRWSGEGGDSILDVGCGDGDVMINVLLKCLPKNYGKLVGVDLSSKMIEYANAVHRNPRIYFHVMDIAAEVNILQQESYDHLFSFNCLHWVQDQRSALQNIHSLLKPGGDCVLSFGAKNQIFNVYKILAEQPRWSVYMNNFSKFVSPYHYSLDPVEEFKNFMFLAGFSEVHVEYKQKSFIYYGIKNLRDSVFAVNPFLEKIPPSLHDEYFEDYMDAVRSLHLIEEDNNNIGDKLTVRAPYFFIVAYAVK